jgi:hypothetical protein
VIQPIVPTCVCRSALLDNQCHSTEVRPPPDLKKIDKTLVTIASCTHDVEMPRRISYPHRLERACPASLTHTDKNGCLALNTSIRPLSLHWRMKLAAAGVRSEALIGWWVSKCDTTGKPESRTASQCIGNWSTAKVLVRYTVSDGCYQPRMNWRARCSRPRRLRRCWAADADLKNRTVHPRATSWPMMTHGLAHYWGTEICNRPRDTGRSRRLVWCGFGNTELNKMRVSSCESWG